MNYSAAAQISWQIAAWETSFASLQFIEKEMLAIGILSLEKIAAGKPQDLNIDPLEWQWIKIESAMLQEAFVSFGLSVTSLRRALRQAAGAGHYRHKQNIFHRSEACKQCFQQAEALVGDGKELKSLHLMVAILSDPGEKIGLLLKNTGIIADDLKLRLIELAGRPIEVPAGELPESDKKRKSYLERFGRNLTKDARDGKLYPFVGREKELSQLIRTLARSTKNNPVLVGEPGVGKTAIVEALATQVAEGKAPDFLADKKIIELNMGVLVAGSIYRGEFEQRLTRIIEETKADSKIILFIDEIHALIGAGQAGGSLDAANILKPALARGELKCIGASTLTDYRKHIEKDAALERRFDMIVVEEPGRSECIEMLQGVRHKLEAFHGVQITQGAMESAVDLSQRFDNDHRLPDKAIDLLDRASARARVAAMKTDSGQEASPNIITEIAVAEVLADVKGIPIEVTSGHIAGNFRNHLIKIGDNLNKHILGQNEAIQRVQERLVIAYSGISEKRGPLAVFLILGPSGVGKTELAKQLALALFGSENSLIRLDMSEYKEEHSVSKLIGSPPGYIGYDEGGQLTGKLRTRPYSILLLDEVEKAHPRVFDLFLQVFDEGHLTDAKGRRIDASNCIVIMTSNIKISKAQKLGFGVQGKNEQSDQIPALKRFFRPELLNRIDEQIVFRHLDKNDMITIVSQKLAALQLRFTERYKVNLNIADEVKFFIVDKESYSEKGVRGLYRTIERLIEAPLGSFMLNNSRPLHSIRLELNDNKILVTAPL